MRRTEQTSGSGEGTLPSRPSKPPNEGPNGDRTTEAYHELRRLILFHRLSPGTPIIQARMAQELGYSRATLRAALKRLSREGYVVEVELGTYSRFVVAALTVEDMEELFAIVGALEGVAVRQCAQLPPKARKELATRMERLNAEVMKKVETGDIQADEANRWDHEFHGAFVQKAIGPRLIAQINAIKPQVERYRDLYITRVAAKMRTLGAPEHEEIVASIRAGDPDRAQRAVEEHWRAGACRLKRLIEELGERRGFSRH